MTVGIARTIQWACLIVIGLALAAIFLAHFHGAITAEAAVILFIAVSAGVAVGISVKADGFIHLRGEQKAKAAVEWEAEAARRFSRKP